MTKIYILEGVDKTGKSTLAKALSEATGFPVKHLGVPPDNIDYARKLNSMIVQYQRGVIFDRFHWGDEVYADITRKGRMLSDGDFEKIEMLLSSLSAVVIYCHASLQEIEGRFEQDGEELINKAHIEELQERYCRVARKSKLPVYLHNFTNNPYNITKKKII